jgi:hypothetical protein
MASLLTGEAVRQGWMSFGLAAASIAAGVAVSNERAVFIPISGVEGAISSTARAFAAIAAPAPVQIGSLYVMPMAALGHRPAARRASPSGTNQLAGNDFTRPDPFATLPGTPGAMSQGTQDQIAQSARMAGNALPSDGTAPVQLASLGGAGGGGFYSGVDVLPGTGSSTPTNPSAPGAPVMAVPEPTSWGLMIAGFALIGGLQRRRVHRSRTSSASFG